jgi:2,3-dihydroxyphenylpropionate 1,2-dioxygenase
MGFTEPAVETRERVDMALGGARKFVAEFDPELVVLFGPDHYNGFFYDMMPSFCIGASAESIGDYDTPAGPLLVDHDVAWTFVRAALDAEIDVALSERMYVDHGVAQPLEVLLGGIDRTPVVPVFINCVAEPIGPARRARLLGSVIGSTAASLNRRVLIVGSGGLSHDPPVPRLEDAAPDVAAALISEGRRLTPEQRAARQLRVIQAGRDYAAGGSRSTRTGTATCWPCWPLANSSRSTLGRPTGSPSRAATPHTRPVLRSPPTPHWPPPEPTR